MARLFLATSNGHKVDEIRVRLGAGFHCVSQRDLKLCLEVDESGATFEENAQIKSVAWARFLSSREEGAGIDYVLADDSGLEVDRLGGAPGVHSARFAAMDEGRPGNSSDAENNAKLQRLLAGVPSSELSARFRCVLALTPLIPGSDVGQLAKSSCLFRGTCEGCLRIEGQGTQGFGYDPLFIPEGFDRSFAELGMETKNAISHRSRALTEMVRWLQNVSAR